MKFGRFPIDYSPFCIAILTSISEIGVTEN